MAGGRKGAVQGSQEGANDPTNSFFLLATEEMEEEPQEGNLETVVSSTEGDAIEIQQAAG